MLWREFFNTLILDTDELGKYADNMSLKVFNYEFEVHK